MTLLGPALGAAGDVGVVAHLGEEAEVLDLGAGERVARVEEAPAHHRAEAVEEEVEVAERGPEQACPGHAELGAAAHHREVAMSASSKPPPSA